MATAIKLLLAALVLHGTYQLGVAYWERYEFEDAVQRAVQFADRHATEQELAESVVGLAEERGIPVGMGDVAVDRRQRQIVVEAAYPRDVQLLPRYFRTFDFSIRVSVVALN